MGKAQAGPPPYFCGLRFLNVGAHGAMRAFAPLCNLNYNFTCGRIMSRREDVMKTHHTIALAMLTGFGLGAVAIQGLHAQAKPPVYQVVEIDVLNPEAYAKDYIPKAQAAIKAAGGKFLAAGGKTTAIEGEPPKSRVVIQQWDSLEKVQAYRNSAAFKDLLPLRDKLAKFRSFVVEGTPL
jgi:uncharacterized protein (DUF1330 family)